MATLPTQSGSFTRSQVHAGSSIDRELAHSYAHCRRVTREASKSFALAARLLPPPKRCAIEALYAFARTSDDIVDEHDEPTGALETWIAQVQGTLAGDDPLLPAWADASQRYTLPSGLTKELLAGVGMDLSIKRYATFSDLQLYCYR